MPLFLIPTVLAAANPLPPPLDAGRTAQIRCVAALAIVASEQRRGINDWGDLPPLAKRGAHFSGTVGEALLKNPGMTREQVRDAMIAGVAQFQKAEELPRETVTSCIALMDKVDPPAPPPSLAECAGTIGLAADDAQKSAPGSANSRLLAAFAAVLNSRARDELRASGKTEVENDTILGRAREKLSADIKARRATPDVEACLELAKP